jgi:hypothetical protein
MTETDSLGWTRRPSDNFRAHAARIAARDWHEIPRGFYAIPVDYYGDCDGTEPENWKPPRAGYRLFERKVARTTKTGRTIGRDRFLTGKVMVTDPDLIDAALHDDKDSLPTGWSYDKCTIDMIVRDAEGDDTYRATFGHLTGRCGHCGRPLTDPTSKLLGIGPDCRGDRRTS